MRNFAPWVAFLILLTSVYLQAQTTSFGSNVMSTSENTQNQKVTGFQPHINVSLGTSFSSFSGGSAFNTWVMPQISLPASKKWNFTVGMGYSTSQYNFSDGWNNQQTNPQYGMLYVSGQYLLSEKITLTGTAYKKWLLNPTSNNETGNNNYLDFSNQGIILDMNYQVSEHLQFNVGVEYRQQNNPMYPGAMSPGMNSGFGNSMPSGGYYPFP